MVFDEATVVTERYASDAISIAQTAHWRDQVGKVVYIRITAEDGVTNFTYKFMFTPKYM